jgi:hypothetical protein
MKVEDGVALSKSHDHRDQRFRGGVLSFTAVQGALRLWLLVLD